MTQGFETFGELSREAQDEMPARVAAWLRDVEADPTETTDRARAHADVVARLVEEARRIRESSAAPHSSGMPAVLDHERAQRLRALGYVVGDP